MPVHAGSHHQNAWLRQRNRGFHVTIRDVDCRDFDVERFIGDLVWMHASFFSFFVGGYVTTYPTALAYQRVSPYLDGRDLAGEIIEAAHQAGLKALGMIDLGQVPEEAAVDHPEWCTQDEHGNLVERVPGLYASCPMGGFQNDYVREIVAEILGRYPLDCVKFGGGSFGFSRSVCYCPSCRRSFRELTGQDLPAGEDWDAPLWRTYTGWRLDQARLRVEALAEVVHSIDPEMPLMGNSVCFGDPGWTVGASIDVEHQAAVADAVQVEIQTRGRYDEGTANGRPVGSTGWQYLAWPAETARFMTSVSDTPIWVVTSYFLAWPWRRSAMAPVEQKVYLAQVAANGADPMVNLSGGPPAVHEDPRGFEVIRDLYGFLDRHRAYYEGDTSGANVALVYSLPTLFYYGKDDPERRYVQEIRGIEQALHAAHIPFDIISTRVLTPDVLARYDVLVLPTLACMSEEEATVIRSYVEGGGSIVTTFETSLYDHEGVRRDDFLLADLTGAHYAGETRSSMCGADEGYKQVYMDIALRHPLLARMEGTSLLPMGGATCLVSAAADADVPLTLSAPFIVFPEGFSYPTAPAPGTPLAVVRHLDGGGRSVTFSGALGSLTWTVPYPDLQELIANAVRWAAADRLPLRVTAPPTLQVSLRKQSVFAYSGREGGSASCPTPCGSGSCPDPRLPQSSHTNGEGEPAVSERRMVHLINLTGGERYFRELVPLRDVEVTLSAEVASGVERAFLLAAGIELPVMSVPGGWKVTVPEIVDYDVLVFELSQG